MVTYLWTYDSYYIYLDGTVSTTPLTGAALSNVETLAESLSLDETGYRQQYNSVVIPALTNSPVNMPSSSVLPYWSYFSVDSLCIPGICGVEADINFDGTNEPKVEVETRNTTNGRALTFHFYNIKGTPGSNAGALTIRYADSNNPQTLDDIYTSPDGHDYIGLAYVSGVPALGDYQWSRWRGMDGGTGTAVSKFKSMVFKRSDTIPSAPEGGSYGQPVPIGWSDGIPSGSGLVWFSTNTFASDNSLKNSWTTPRLMADSQWMDYEYHNALADGSKPEAPQKLSPSDTTDYGDGWSNTSTTGTTWMGMRSVENGVYSGEWEIIKIKGEDGVSSVDIIEFYAAGTKEGYPSGLPTDGNETENWKRNLKDVSFSDENKVIWNYEATKMADGSFRFSGPAIIGINGEDGRGIIEIVNYYAVNNNMGSAPDGYDDENPETSGNWSTDASSKATTTETPYLWNFEELRWNDNTRTRTNPVIICAMGAPGANAVLGDLDNEGDQVAVDDNSRSINDASFSTNASFYNGVSAITITRASVIMGDGSKKELTDGTVTVIVSPDSTGSGGVSVSYNSVLQRFSIYINSGTELNEPLKVNFNIGCTIGDTDYDSTVQYKIVPVKGGENAELFDLLPSFSEIKVDADGNHLPDKISCSVYHRIGMRTPEEITFLNNDEKYELYYNIDGISGGRIATGEEIATDAIVNYIKFSLKISGVDYGVDETVLVLRDGTKGIDGIGINIKNEGKPVSSLPSNSMDGDAYYMNVTNAETGNVEVHLFIWYSSRGTNGEWVDCGNLKGEQGAAGVSQYIHIKYAELSSPGEGYWFYASSLGGTCLKLTDIDTDFPYYGEKPGRFIGIAVTSEAQDPAIVTGSTDTVYSWQKWEGQDGYGYEYAYTVTTDENSRPDVPVFSDDFMSSSEYQSDDFIPYGWKEGPQTIDDINKYCWVIYRVKDNGKWTEYRGEKVGGAKKAVLYSRYAEDGTSINVRWYAKGVVGTVANLANIQNPSNGDVYYVSSITACYAYSTNSVAWKPLDEVYTDTKNGDGVVVSIDGENVLYLYSTSSDSKWVYCGKFGGKDGESSYIHIKYADADFSASPNPDTSIYIDYLGVYLKFTMPSAEFPVKGEAPGAYFGTYNDTNKDDSNSLLDYHWVKAEGKDGIAYEYIFQMVSPTGNVPVIPTATSVTIQGVVKTMYDDDFVPNGWSDNPDSISKSYPSRYKCYRVKRNGVWSKFMGVSGSTDPGTLAILDAQYGMDGTSIQLKGTASKTFDSVESLTASTADDGVIYCAYSNGSLTGEFYKRTNGAWVKIIGVEDGEAYTAPIINEEGKEGLSIFLWSISAGGFMYGGPFGGTNGKDGLDGTDGVSWYVHIKYANATTGSTSEPNYIDYLGTNIIYTPISGSFTKVGEAPGRYIGIVADNVDIDPEPYSAYTWNLSQGSDGIGYEYIYKNVSKGGPVPSVPVATSNTITGKNVNDDDFVPEGWTDNPESISEALPRRYMCYRIKRNDKWGAFLGEGGQSGITEGSVLAILDAQYGVDGTSIKLKGTASKTFASYSSFSALTETEGVIYCVYNSGNYASFYKRTSTGWQKITGEAEGDSYTAPLTEDDGTTRSYIFLWTPSEGSNGEFVLGGPFSGEAGKNGKSSYIHVKFANAVETGGIPVSYLGVNLVLTPTSETFTVLGEAPGRYMGTYVDENISDSFAISSYTWTNAEGVDGIGYEYIYQMSTGNTAPSVPTATSNTVTGKNASDDDFVPVGWVDNPESISESLPYRWKCYRVKREGVWSAFMGANAKSGSEGGVAILDANYGRDGEDNITIDLSNEFDSIPLTSDGLTTSSGKVSTTVTIYKGTKAALGYTITAVAKNSVGGSETGVTITTGSTGNIEVKYSSGVSLSERTTVDITATGTIGDTQYTKSTSLTIIGMKAAVAGKNAVVYKIMPTDSVIHRTNANTDSPSSIDCVVMCYEGNIVTDYTETAKSSKLLYQSVDSAPLVTYTGATNTNTILGRIKYSLYSTSARTELWDTETVPVVADGQDGSGASPIVIDVDNEVMSVGVKSDGAVISAAEFYTDVIAWSGSTQMSITGMTNGEQTINDITASTAFLANESDGPQFARIYIRIATGKIMPPVTTFIFRAIMEGGYERSFTVKVCGIPGGEDGTPAVVYNIVPDNRYIRIASDGTISPSAIKINVMKTVGSDVSDATLSLISGGLITYSKDNGIEMAYNTTAASNGVPTSGVDSYITFTVYSSEGEILDKENVVVIKDGLDGESSYPITIDLSSENINIGVNSDGRTVNTINETTEITAYSGSTQLAITSVTPTNYASGSTNGLTVSAAINATSGVTVQLQAGSGVVIPDSFTYRFTLGFSGISGTKTAQLRVNSIRGGADGKPGVVYEIIPSVNSISKVYDDEGNTVISPASVYCNILRVSGDSRTLLTNLPSGFALKYARSTTATTYSDMITSTTAIISATTVSTSGISNGLTFVLTENGSVIDKETIPLVSDGKQGMEGPKGEDGVSSSFLLLTNQNQSLMTTADGKLVSADSTIKVTTDAYLYYGGELIRPQGATPSGTTLSTLSVVTGTEIITGITATLYDDHVGFEIRIPSGSTLTDIISFPLTVGGYDSKNNQIIRQSYINITPVAQGKQGEPGAPAEATYDLMMSSQLVHSDPEGLVKDPAVINFRYVKTGPDGAEYNTFSNDDTIGLLCRANHKDGTFEMYSTWSNFGTLMAGGQLDTSLFDTLLVGMYYMPDSQYDPTKGRMLDFQNVNTVYDGIPASDVWLSSNIGVVSLSYEGKATQSTTFTVNVGMKVGNENLTLTNIQQSSEVKANVSATVSLTNKRLTVLVNPGAEGLEPHTINVLVTGTTSSGIVYNGEKTFTLCGVRASAPSNLDYLSGVFGEDNVESKTGATLTEFLAVYDRTGTTSTDKQLVAFINGNPDVASSQNEPTSSAETREGTLVFAGGVPSMQNANESKFRVYANGNVYAESFRLNNKSAGLVGEGDVSKDTDVMMWGGRDKQEWDC